MPAPLAPENNNPHAMSAYVYIIRQRRWRLACTTLLIPANEWSQMAWSDVQQHFGRYWIEGDSRDARDLLEVVERSKSELADGETFQLASAATKARYFYALDSLKPIAPSRRHRSRSHSRHRANNRPRHPTTDSHTTRVRFDDGAHSHGNRPSPTTQHTHSHITGAGIQANQHAPPADGKAPRSSRSRSSHRRHRSSHRRSSRRRHRRHARRRYRRHARRSSHDSHYSGGSSHGHSRSRSDSRSHSRSRSHRREWSPVPHFSDQRFAVLFRVPLFPPDINHQYFDLYPASAAWSKRKAKDDRLLQLRAAVCINPRYLMRDVITNLHARHSILGHLRSVHSWGVKEPKPEPHNPLPAIADTLIPLLRATCMHAILRQNNAFADNWQSAFLHLRSQMIKLTMCDMAILENNSDKAVYLEFLDHITRFRYTTLRDGSANDWNAWALVLARTNRAHNSYNDMSHYSNSVSFSAPIHAASATQASYALRSSNTPIASYATNQRAPFKPRAVVSQGVKKWNRARCAAAKVAVNTVIPDGSGRIWWGNYCRGYFNGHRCNYNPCTFIHRCMRCDTAHNHEAPCPSKPSS